SRDRAADAGDVNAEALQPPQLSSDQRQSGWRVQHDAEQHERRQDYQEDRSDEQASPHSELCRDVEVEARAAARLGERLRDVHAEARDGNVVTHAEASRVLETGLLEVVERIA